MTTLLLTNRLKNAFFKTWPAFIIGVVAYSVIFVKCNNSGFDFKTSARMGIPIVLAQDTTKPKPKAILNHYKLEGSDTLFQMLWLQVQSPVDVTPRSLQLLKNWLQSSIKIDSTIKQ